MLLSAYYVFTKDNERIARIAVLVHILNDTGRVIRFLCMYDEFWINF